MNLPYLSWSILGRIRAWVGGLMVLKAVGSSWCFVCIAAADLTNGEYGVSQVSELTSPETCNEQLGYTRCGTASHHVNRISSEKKTGISSLHLFQTCSGRVTIASRAIRAARAL